MITFDSFICVMGAYLMMELTYKYSFGVEQIPKETKKIRGSKNVITNVFRIQAYNSMMSGYFCIYMVSIENFKNLKYHTFLEKSSSLFSINEY